MKLSKFAVASLLAACTVLSSPVFAADSGKKEIVEQEFMIPASDPGIQLYVREKHLKGLTKFPSNKVLLFVHGSTYAAETTFDLELNGMSWMDYIARDGYDVYLVDLRNYGKSTRTPEMFEPVDKNPPIVRTATAVKDVSTAVDFVLKRTGVSKLDLMGWSWGTTIMGSYTSQHNEKVNKLVLDAPQWLRNGPSKTDQGGKLGAYRVISMASAKARWLDGVAPDQQATLIPPGWYETWEKATLADDPIAVKKGTPFLYEPSGTTADSREYWASGKPVYDPSQIRVPVLAVHANWDADLPSYMLPAYLAQLTNAPYARYVEIAEGTHTLMLEKNRMQMFTAVQQFLNEDIHPGM
jgi:pimeloyl-ACP methyl ester carboxylesterase